MKRAPIQYRLAKSKLMGLDTSSDEDSPRRPAAAAAAGRAAADRNAAMMLETLRASVCGGVAATAPLTPLAPHSPTLSQRLSSLEAAASRPVAAPTPTPGSAARAALDHRIRSLEATMQGLRQIGRASCRERV